MSERLLLPTLTLPCILCSGKQKNWQYGESNERAPKYQQLQSKACVCRRVKVEARGVFEAVKRLGIPSGTFQVWRAARQASKSGGQLPVEPLKRSYSELEARLEE